MAAPMSPVVLPGLAAAMPGGEALIGHFDQALGLAGDFADRIHAARVAVPAIDDQGDVDIDDVALAQRPLVGNAVADDVVDRGADRVPVALVEQRRRDGVVVARELVGQPVERRGGDAGLHCVDQQVERLGGQPSGLAHAGEARPRHAGGSPRRCGGFVVGIDIGDHQGTPLDVAER